MSAWRGAALRARLDLLAPVLLALLLGAVQLARRQPLWYDEAYTAQVAPLSLPDLAHLVGSGTGPTAYLPEVPPSFNAPYYALMHLWLQLPFTDTGATWLRLPSLLCAAAAAVVVAEVVRRLAGRRAGLLAGLLVATGPLLVEQSVEARSNSAAVLATALAALGLVRWWGDGRGCVGGGAGLFGIWLFGTAAAAAGLLHWFALPAIAGLVVGALLLLGRTDPRRSASVALVGLAAALPTLALIALSASHDGSGGPVPPPVGLRLPAYALNDWAVGERPLAVLTAGLAVVALLRSPARVLLGAWLVVGLALITVAELVQPVYFPRYLLPTLLAFAALAAVGACSLPAPWRGVAVAAVLLAALAADVPRLTRLPRERPDAVVAQLLAQQAAGEPIVAVDARAALDLDQYVSRDGPRLRPDVILPPDDLPATTVAPRAWLVRFSPPSQRGKPLTRQDDDDLLAAGRWWLTSSTTYEGVSGDLTVQRWERP